MSLQTRPEIDGVKFFEQPYACISDFNAARWTEKYTSLIHSYGSFLTYSMKTYFRRMTMQVEAFTNDHKPFVEKRLVVCIHGLNSDPSQFNQIIAEMQEKELTETDIFIPHVLQKGNAKLSEMTQPILNVITRWAENPGEKTLVLVGISNGARIARAVEAEMAKLNHVETIKKLQLISIVGACKGSSLANLANKLGLSWLMSKNISEEMPVGSERNQQLNQDWIDGLSTGLAREYTFIASPHDWQVPNYDSSLMEVGYPATTRYAIVPGHGHNSIVNAVAKTVASIICLF